MSILRQAPLSYPALVLLDRGRRPAPPNQRSDCLGQLPSQLRRAAGGYAEKEKRTESEMSQKHLSTEELGQRLRAAHGNTDRWEKATEVVRKSSCLVSDMPSKQLGGRTRSPRRPVWHGNCLNIGTHLARCVTVKLRACCTEMSPFYHHLCLYPGARQAYPCHKNIRRERRCQTARVLTDSPCVMERSFRCRPSLLRALSCVSASYSRPPRSPKPATREPVMNRRESLLEGL